MRPLNVARARDRDDVLAGDPGRRPRQHQRAVSERDRLGDVVGHEHDRLAAEIPEPEQVLLQVQAGLRIERAERLVHQDDRRIVGERADQRGPLAHAAGQLMRIVVLEAGEADGADQHVRARPRLGVEPPLDVEREQHVLQRRAPRQEIILLRHVADAAGQPGIERLGVAERSNLRLVAHLPAARGVDLRDHVEQRGLAGARGPDDGEELAVGDREAQVLNDPRRGLAAAARGEPLAQVADFEQGLAGHGHVLASSVASAGGRQRSSRRSAALTLQLPRKTIKVVATSATNIPVVSKFMAPSCTR